VSLIHNSYIVKQAKVKLDKENLTEVVTSGEIRKSKAVEKGSSIGVPSGLAMLALRPELPLAGSNLKCNRMGLVLS
jgi:hypothetical protein